MPRNFFENHVKPNYEEWLADPLDERHAKNTVSDANIMAERVFHYWKDRDPTRVYSAKRPRPYRKALVAKECDDFQLVWDVADGHKHVELDRNPRHVTRRGQTGVGILGYGETRYGEGIYGGAKQLVVTLDDGTKRPLSAIMKNVMVMWGRILAEMSL